MAQLLAAQRDHMKTYASSRCACGSSAAHTELFVFGPQRIYRQVQEAGFTDYFEEEVSRLERQLNKNFAKRVAKSLRDEGLTDSDIQSLFSACGPGCALIALEFYRALGRVLNDQLLTCLLFGSGSQFVIAPEGSTIYTLTALRHGMVNTNLSLTQKIAVLRTLGLSRDNIPTSGGNYHLGKLLKGAASLHRL
jgi:hypothetical protein